MERILVLDTAFLGDCLLSLPLLEALFEARKPLEIGVITTPLAQDLFLGRPGVKEVFIWDKRKDKTPWGLMGLAKRLKGFRANIALSTHKSSRSALLLSLARVPWRIGFSTSRLRFLYHELVPEEKDLPVVLRKLSLLHPLGIPTPQRVAPLRHSGIQPAQVGHLKERLTEALGHDPQNLMGIAPGSVWPTKRWPAEYFGDLIQLFKDRLGAECVIMGGAEDRDIALTIKERLDFSVADFTGRTTIGELFALIRTCRLVVSNDSAPMHAAFLLGVPVVGIFGPTTQAFGFFPFGPHARVAELGLSCRPCARHGGKHCPKGHFLCMRGLSPEEVFTLASSLLASQGNRSN
jgi:heptosyltransferase-2